MQTAVLAYKNTAILVSIFVLMRGLADIIPDSWMEYGGIMSADPEYIVLLEMKVDIHEAIPMEYARISELTQRTNRKTNGIRYTVEELKTIVTNQEFKLYSVRVSDRFSDLGIVGAIAIEGNEL